MSRTFAKPVPIEVEVPWLTRLYDELLVTHHHEYAVAGAASIQIAVSTAHFHQKRAHIDRALAWLPKVQTHARRVAELRGLDVDHQRVTSLAQWGPKLRAIPDGWDA